MKDQFSFHLSDEEKVQIDQAFDILANVFEPKLTTLTKEDSKEMAKMGDKTVAFVEKAIEYAQEYPEYIPAYIDVPEAQADFDAVKKLRFYFTQLDRMVSQLDDSMTLAGSEAYGSSLVIYKILKNAASMGQPGAEEAAKELANRFPRGKRKPAPEAN